MFLILFFYIFASSIHATSQPLEGCQVATLEQRFVAGVGSQVVGLQGIEDFTEPLKPLLRRRLYLGGMTSEQIGLGQRQNFTLLDALNRLRTDMILLTSPIKTWLFCVQHLPKIGVQILKMSDICHNYVKKVLYM